MKSTSDWGRPVLVVVLAGVVGAAGAFGGNWGWDAFKSWRADQAAERASNSPIGIQRQVVGARLFDASTAVFRNERQSAKDVLAWCGEVNARNRMGAMVGFRRYVVVFRIDPATPATRGEAISAARLDIDPDKDNRFEAPQAEFEAQWATYCG